MSSVDVRDIGLMIRQLEERDVQLIASEFQNIGSKTKTPSLYQRYLLEQNNERRTVLVAFVEDAFAGYLTVDGRSGYPPLRQGDVPEITDFNVLPRFRRRGIGTRLMDEAERRVAERSTIVGVGFGVDPDYGAAQRMYVLRGYVPDGRSLRYKDRHVKYGDNVTIDDGLALFLTKQLGANPR